MPHFVIEYSRGLDGSIDIREAMTAAFDAGTRSGIMDPRDIKVRAIAFDHVLLQGGIVSFLHISVFLLEGRTDAQKEGLAILLREGFSSRYPDIGSISIDIRDMNPIAYKKRLLASPP